MCSAFTLDCGYDNSIINLTGDVYCPNTKSSGKLCLNKKSFESLARSIINVRNARVFQVRNIPFEDQTNSFFCHLAKGLLFWIESIIKSRWYWRCVMSWQVFCQQREVGISWRLCNNSEIHLWLWKLCGLAGCSQSSFHVTRERKGDKKRQNTIFLYQGKMKLLPDKQLFNNVPFQSSKDRKKELCVDNKVQETIGDVYCPICRNEECVYILPNKTSNFYDCKKCKSCCHVLNNPFTGRKPRISLIASDGTHCFARKASRDYEKEKPSPLLKKSLRQHPNLNQSRQKLFHLWHNRVDNPLVYYNLIFFTFSLK